MFRSLSTAGTLFAARQAHKGFRDHLQAFKYKAGSSGALWLCKCTPSHPGVHSLDPVSMYQLIMHGALDAYQQASPLSPISLASPYPDFRCILLGTVRPLRRSFGQTGAAMEHSGAGLSEKDEQLLRLFLSICCHKWQDLNMYSQQSLDRGASQAELLGCVRHICV